MLEGLTSGKPVVGAIGSCLEEAGGNAAIYVNPESPEEMTDALGSILRGEADIEGMVARGLKHASRFRLADMAGKVREVYSKIM